MGKFDENRKRENSIVNLKELDKQHTFRAKNLTVVFMVEGERDFDMTDENTKVKSHIEYTKQNCVKIAAFGKLNGKSGIVTMELPILDYRRILDWTMTEPHRSYLNDMVKVEVSRNTGFEDLPEAPKK